MYNGSMQLDATRHGDVLTYKADSMKDTLLYHLNMVNAPKDIIQKVEKEFDESKVRFTPVQEEKCVLRTGEVTGHAHVIDNKNGQVLEFVEPITNTRFIQLESDQKLVHEEHKPQVLEKGTHMVEFERRYDYFLRQVNVARD